MTKRIHELETSFHNLMETFIYVIV